jgi:hypothetical protein
MATFQQIPGTLDITFVGGGGSGDEVAIALDFDQDLTGYTITAPIYVTNVYASTGGGQGLVTTVGSTATSFAVQPTNLSQGQVTIALSETQTGNLSPSVGYRWYMRWVSPSFVTRTVLSGTVTVANP